MMMMIRRHIDINILPSFLMARATLVIIIIITRGSRSPCMRPKSDPPNFGPIERSEKQTNNID